MCKMKFTTSSKSIHDLILTLANRRAQFHCNIRIGEPSVWVLEKACEHINSGAEAMEFHVAQRSVALGFSKGPHYDIRL